MNRKILLVGAVSNVAKNIERELDVVLRALSIFDHIEIFLVESDSVDSTNYVLEKMKSNHLNFDFKTLGNLREKYPNRVERIAYCRNIYVEHIRNNYQISEWSFVAVADLDGMNFKLSQMGVKSCLESDIEWDGVMANQSFGYYDIYALRARNWVEEDCFEALQKYKIKRLAHTKNKKSAYGFIRNYIVSDYARHKFIYSKMRRIDRYDSWVPVYSAFGGFAIYKPWVFLNFDYSAMPGRYTNSEHVDFHEKTAVAGPRYFINPYLINSNINEYNLNKLKLVRLAKFLKSRFAF